MSDNSFSIIEFLQGGSKIKLDLDKYQYTQGISVWFKTWIDIILTKILQKFDKVLENEVF